ncbi:MAG: hypothetical protein IJX47_01065 [Clostridia bacterium]|nr:hypothetical protein [Clostridia bacterium]
MKYLAYALIILTLSSVVLASCDDAADTGSSDGTTAATTTAIITPANTVDRDKLTDPNLSEDDAAFLRAVWAAVKDTVDESVTINDLDVSKYKKVDDVFMGHYYGNKVTGDYVTAGEMITTVTVGGYDFIFGSTLIPSIFTDGKQYSLESAYSSGAITEDQLRRLWEMHKEGNLYYDEQ